MRHAKTGKRFGRNSSLRKATVRDIAKATLLHQKINTTQTKAKESRKLVDKLITLGKKGTLAAKRRAFQILCNHKVVSSLFNEIAPLFKNRLGGYTRIIPLPHGRRGDNASLVILELTEKTVVSSPKKKSDKKSSKEEKKTVDEKLEKVAVAKKSGKEKKAVKKDDKESKSTQESKEESSKGVPRGIKKIFRKKSK